MIKSKKEKQLAILIAFNFRNFTNYYPFSFVIFFLFLELLICS